MPDPCVSVVIPTLAADETLAECVRSLEAQSRSDFEVVIVDNSGKQLVRRHEFTDSRVTVIENASNVGFGAAFNQAFHRTKTPYVAVLNDDAIAAKDWIAAFMAAAESAPDAGMWASQVRLYPEGGLDSAGMLICADGSSKQRGHRGDPAAFAAPAEVLLPSGSAALYRRKMLEEIGLFDERFFLYCEDTDLGLRARWAGWKCFYVPDAIVDHRYSHTAGEASGMKAYYVERNRLFTVFKNFPPGMFEVLRHSALRYFWHWKYMRAGKGAAARNGDAPGLIRLALKANIAGWSRFFEMRRSYREMRKTARLSEPEFRALLCAHNISARRVASL